MKRSFELDEGNLNEHIEELVDVTFGDLQSQFLVLPRGPGYIEYGDFQVAYETLKAQTRGFRVFDATRLWRAVVADALVIVVVRTILGFSPPEWAEVAEAESEIEIPQGAVRSLDRLVRAERRYFADPARARTVSGRRARALLEIAARFIREGAPPQQAGFTHRLAKADTMEGLQSVQNAANLHVPYAMLLYERYLGRPYASHRDSVSELVGDLMEDAIEEHLDKHGITNRRTKRAERVVGFDQAPDFLVPTEFAPTVVIEAKLTNDDGTARDKVTRILHLAELRDERERAGMPVFEVVACIDGRGFGVRRQDMRRLILATRGKVFTFSSLSKLVRSTRLREFTAN